MKNAFKMMVGFFLILAGCTPVGEVIKNNQLLVQMDNSISTDAELCQYKKLRQGKTSLYRNNLNLLIKELKRRGVTREKCIKLTGDEGIYAEVYPKTKKINSTKNSDILLKIFNDISNLDFYVKSGSHLKINLQNGYIFYHGKHKKFLDIAKQEISNSFYATTNWNPKTPPKIKDLNWVNTNISFRNFIGKKYAVLKLDDFTKIELQNKKNTKFIFAIKINNTYTGSGFTFKSNDYSIAQLLRHIKGRNKSLVSNQNSKSTSSSAELKASKRVAETERQKRIELERKLAAMEAKQKQERQRIDTDTRVPLLEILSNKTKGKRGTITGIARDNVEVAEVTIDGKAVQLSGNGNFKYSTFVPSDGITLNIQVTDLAGLTSSKTVSLQRNDSTVSTSITFDRLNPLGKRVKGNSNALALIVGVEGYENTNADALYADRDAKMFRDYASEKLGIPDNRIKTLLNDKAEYAEILLTTKDWLRRASKANKSDIYIFFAGHGLASDDGKNMYLLPYDGRPRLLDKTALLRDELFKEIQQSNPLSVTVFLDTCYSGTTRGTDVLIASRPIAIRAIEQSIPENFTVFSAAAGDQTSKPLEEAKHGMFSYFLMKGMEGDADTNSDNKITARELHAYVKQNVVQQSSGSQTPELQGDKDRVLVKFK